MSSNRSLPYDHIGYWSLIKHDIVSKYAKAYSTNLTAQEKNNPRFCHVYIDAFAGSGIHKTKSTGEFVPGSPINALDIDPPFCEYYFSDIDSKKLDLLKRNVGDRPNVHFFEGDCNVILLRDVFPKIRWENYHRGLCLLDPYGLQLNWEVIRKAGEMQSIDMFLNFPVADINRNVLWHDVEGVDPKNISRMNAYWGDESWRKVAYTTERDLFEHPEKESNETIAEGFRTRLQRVAGFAFVPKPLPMRNTVGAIVYYLFFASQKEVASNILKDIFKTYINRSK